VLVMLEPGWQVKPRVVWPCPDIGARLTQSKKRKSENKVVGWHMAEWMGKLASSKATWEICCFSKKERKIPIG